MRRAAILGGCLLAAGLLAWVLLWSPVLGLRADDVQVSGAGGVVDVQQVRAVVGAHDGTPLPRLDLGAVRAAVLDVPGVRAVEVSRDWPHGVVLGLVAREPVAAVPDGTGFGLLDDEGVQVGRVDTAPNGLPVVDVPADDPRTVTAVLAVLHGLPPGLLADVGSVSAQSLDTVRLGLRDGTQVEWGSADQTALKAAVLQALRAAPQSAGARVVDVSAPTLPVTR